MAMNLRTLGIWAAIIVALAGMYALTTPGNRTPTISEILDKAQRGFLLNRSIEDNIFEVNQAFYSHLETKSDLHVLLHDFEKAYDSASRRFLFAVLKKVGMPEWIVRILRLLFVKVTATPILPGPHKTSINMPNGLKQGCPLSSTSYWTPS